MSEVIFFELDSFDDAIQTRLENWRCTLTSLPDCPDIDWVFESGEEAAKRAAWRGLPFIIAGSHRAIRRYFSGLDQDSVKVLSDCAYFWVLTDSRTFHHEYLPGDRPVSLDWHLDNQRVVRDALVLLNASENLKGLSSRTDWMRREILRIADGPTSPGYPVLILGPSGSGKERVAEALFSIRKAVAIADRPAMEDFHAVGGAWLRQDPGMALSELKGIGPNRATGVMETDGLLGTFSSGTLFIDDFDTAPTSVQETLLRLMDADPGQPAEYTRVGETTEKQTRVWLLFSTNADIQEFLSGTDTKLRKDFLYRFEDRVIVVPALKDRPADFAAIVRFIWKSLPWPKEVERPVLSSDVIRFIFAKRLQWEGNVRALRALLALALSMKRNPVHNLTSLAGPGGLFDIITSRGPGYLDWVGVMATNYPATAATPEQQIRDADNSHPGRFCLPGNHEPSEDNLTPSERAACDALTVEGWKIFRAIVAKQKPNNNPKRIRLSVRLARIVWFVSMHPSIGPAQVRSLTGISEGIAPKDLALLAGPDGLLVAAAQEPGRYTKSSRYFQH